MREQEEERFKNTATSVENESEEAHVGGRLWSQMGWEVKPGF